MILEPCSKTMSLISFLSKELSQREWNRECHPFGKDNIAKLNPVNTVSHELLQQEDRARSEDVAGFLAILFRVGSPGSVLPRPLVISKDNVERVSAACDLGWQQPEEVAEEGSHHTRCK